jgi:hypothetical protein
MFNPEFDLGAILGSFGEAALGSCGAARRMRDTLISLRR